MTRENVMKKDDLTPPEFGAPTPPYHQSDDTLKLMAGRRSTAADCLGAPGPSPDELAQLLTIAARAPDHRRVTPFRFIVFDGDRRTEFGKILADAFRKNEPDASDERVAKERARFERAPIVVAVVSSVQRVHRTPAWEQVLTTGAVCQNLLIAASASGFAAQWLTEWYAYDAHVVASLGLRQDDDLDERIAGFIYIGTAKEPPMERARPDVPSLISHF